MRQLVQYSRWQQQRGGGVRVKRSGMQAMYAHCPLPHLGGRR